MGFESYNFKVRILSDCDANLVVDAFLKMGYTIFENNVLEKSLESGFIEVMMNQNDISIRTAKANDENTITEIIKDTETLNSIIKISVFDLQLKQVVSLESFYEVFTNFRLLRNEFYKQYPNTKYPTRCNDVFK